MTPAQQKLYDHLVQGSGNAMEAQKVILGELNKEFGGAAEAARKGSFSGSMARAQDAIGDASARWGCCSCRR